MAHSQHAAAKHRSRRRHQTRSPSTSRHHDWDSRHLANPHSLPYRPRQPNIRRGPAGWNPNYYPHRSAPPSDDEDDEDTDDFEVVIPDPDPMPHPQQQQLTRAAGASARKNGKGRAVYLEVEEDDDDDDQEQMISRLRSRSRPRTQSKVRSRAQSKARADSSSGDDETIELSTPPASVPVTPRYRSRQTSRLPSPSSSRSSSVDSDTSSSTPDMRLQRRSRSRRPSETRVTPPPPVADRAGRQRHQHGRRNRSATFREESDDEPEFDNRIRLRARSKSVPRQPTRNMDSRSSSMRRTYRLRSRDRYDEGEPSSSSRRPNYRGRYYESDTGYPEKPSLPRAHTAPSSHVTSHSMSSSSRHSLAFLNRLIGPGLQSSSNKPSKMDECAGCYDDFPTKEMVKLKCKHRMCKRCLKRKFKRSVKDPSQMPPRCCTAECIPLEHVSDMFDDNFKFTWNQKFGEFSTRNRVYCPGKKCGHWIRPDQIQRHQNGRKVGKCSSCQTKVCCECNNRWHGSAPCPEDEEVDQFLQRAKEEGWQRCYNCRNMVELKEGCNHMTCSRCGAQFCMICGLAWKTCECPWFNYDNAEIDHFDQMQIPEPVIAPERLNRRSAPAPVAPGMDSRRRSPGDGLRSRQSPFGSDERLLRRFEQQQQQQQQIQQDEELAHRLQFEETEDDYMSPEDIGGNHAGPFVRDGYTRRRAQTVVAPPAPAPPPVAPFDRANSVIGDYVHGVNRARHVGAPRASSMERRLADRFGQRQSNSPAQHAFGLNIPPPPAPPRAMGPPPIPQVPLGPLGQPPMLSRRHTVDDDFHFDTPRANRVPEHMLPRRASARGFVEEPAYYDPTPRSRRRERAQSTSPKDSVLAGLGGPGRGMHRVYEWVNHVDPDPLAT